jgi:hypothetical protein
MVYLSWIVPGFDIIMNSGLFVACDKPFSKPNSLIKGVFLDDSGGMARLELFTDHLSMIAGEDD